MNALVNFFFHENDPQYRDRIKRPPSGSTKKAARRDHNHTLSARKAFSVMRGTSLAKVF